LIKEYCGNNKVFKLMNSQHGQLSVEKDEKMQEEIKENAGPANS
jgi:hypothetical protein